MKKIILPILTIFLLTSCGDSNNEQKAASAASTETPAASSDDLSANPIYQKGLGLVAKSDCLTCHKIDDVLTGPSYKDIAVKYASSSDTIVKYLASKILKGGNGVWGEAIMTPHPALSEEDASAMVQYILLLKK